MRGVKQKLESQYDERDSDFVLQTRIGWKKFNTVWLEQSFETPQQAQGRIAKQGVKERPHGVKKENLNIDQEALLLAASAWQDDKEINWTALGTKYGLTNPNRGQIIKEFLKDHGIKAAMTVQHEVRRTLKLPGGEIAQPKHKPVTYQKAQVAKKIEEGDGHTHSPIGIYRV